MKLKTKQEMIKKDFDIKNYAGFEVEHSSATTPDLTNQHGTHIVPRITAEFKNKSDKVNSEIRSRALLEKQ